MTRGATQDVTSTPEQDTILVVDDTPENLTILGELLRPHYRVRAANCGERALRAAASAPRPNLILLDVMMPDMDGHAVLKRLRADPDTQDIPVIFVTAMSGMEDEELGLSLGAVDYITKPLKPAIVLARVRTHLELKQARDRLVDQNQWLEREVGRRMRENLLIQDLSIRSLACLAEARDNETGHHILRTQAYVRLLAGHLRDHPRFRGALDGPRLEMIVKAAPLHDIGKVGIPDAILLKPGKLTAEEYEIMKTHSEIGAQAIDRAMKQAMADSPDLLPDLPVSAFSFLQVAREISIAHHEKWDGSGYPSGLAGEAIPVAARLMALADVFDALVCQRVYKKPMSQAEARAIILEGKGRHFDPDVVDAFMDLLDDFSAIAQRYTDIAEEA